MSKTLLISNRLFLGRARENGVWSARFRFNGMSHFLSLVGRESERKWCLVRPVQVQWHVSFSQPRWQVSIINLDPANDSLPYDCAVNIDDLIKLGDVMMEHSMILNGGEVELFFLHSNAKNVIAKLMKKLNLRVTAFDFNWPYHGEISLRKLTKELCDVIEDYTASILDEESVANLLRLIDKSNGYIFAGIDASTVEFGKIAVRDVDWKRYIKEDDNIDYDGAWIWNCDQFIKVYKGS